MVGMTAIVPDGRRRGSRFLSTPKVAGPDKLDAIVADIEPHDGARQSGPSRIVLVQGWSVPGIIEQERRLFTDMRNKHDAT
jgi:hypothetical protein